MVVAFNQEALVGAFSVIVKSSRTFVCSSRHITVGGGGEVVSGDGSRNKERKELSAGHHRHRSTQPRPRWESWK